MATWKKTTDRRTKALIHKIRDEPRARADKITDRTPDMTQALAWIKIRDDTTSIIFWRFVYEILDSIRQDLSKD